MGVERGRGGGVVGVGEKEFNLLSKYEYSDERADHLGHTDFQLHSALPHCAVDVPVLCVRTTRRNDLQRLCNIRNSN